MSGVGSSTLVLLLFQTVWLHTSLVNAELAFLGQEPFRAFASQGAQNGDFLYQFFVTDTQSQSPPSFSVEQIDTLPFVLSSDGMLFVAGSLSEEQYSFTVEVMSASGTIATNITITVVSISDTTPRFEHARYDIEISEALSVGSAFSVVRAFPLNPQTQVQRYSIVDGNTDNDISINSDTGLLRVDRHLDRERTKQYQLTVRYVEDDASLDAAVQLLVLDVNDQHPQFTLTLYREMISETVPIGRPVLTVSASDADLGLNARVNYTLDSSVSGTFSLGSEDGVLRTAAPLDYESRQRYQFRVIATDGGDPPLSSVATVLVELMNVDDECPRFENPIFVEELSYDTGTPPSVGTEILTVVASDPDRLSNVTYSIASGQTDVLELNSRTGVIVLASTERDPRGQYFLNVSASDASCTGRSFVRVEIGIGNVNDHSPQFVTDCVGTLRENPSPGTEVVTLQASDLDIGFNGLVTYSLLSDLTLFAIDSTSGVVRTIASPDSYDRETRATRQIGVTASDGGGRQDYCSLTITLTDENDNHPRIPLSEYSTSVSRGSGVGTFVLQITADDPDVGENGRIVYSIAHPSPLPFQIGNVSGIITTTGDSLSENSYTFSVVAADLGTDVQLSSNSTVTITLTDSDALPVFSQQNYTASVCENAPTGTTVLTVSVSSAEFVQFEIQAGNDYRSNSGETFFITQDLNSFNIAYITVGSQSFVNFELLHPSLSFQFFVSATTISGVSSLALVEIFVTDVDDNRPEFVSEFSISIPENFPVGMTVAQVQAIDMDHGTNGDIAYRFREASPYFNITNNGMIYPIQIFDFETSLTTSGHLLVEAYNPNPEPSNAECSSSRSDPTTEPITWSIIDQNDNPPFFPQSMYTVQVREDASLHSRLLRLNATDRDVSDLGRLSFSIISGNDGRFSIESDFITLTSRLDFETTPTYDLVIEVTDEAPSTSDRQCSQCMTTVRIQVTDVDDEPPVFTQPEYHTRVVENALIGTSILTLSATDVDSTSIQFELTGLAVGRFSVNQTGVVFVSGVIDREEFPGGRLVFLAFAEGGGLVTPADVTIDIDDVNDYVPRFSTVLGGTVEENNSPGEMGIYAGEVRAVDLDEGENGTLRYSIVSGGENGFRIDAETGVITAHAQYDRENVSSYELIIEARDNGSQEQLSSRMPVTIDIGDVNDNPTSFPFTYMYSRLFENSPNGHSVFFLPTMDPDSAVNSAPRFTLEATNPPEAKFDLDAITGEITVAGSLDYEIPLHRLYTLTVSVEDVEYPPTASGTVQIQLLDRNDNEPRVNISQLQSILQETLPSGVQVATVMASDRDSGSNSELIFEITDGNTDNDFELNVENGVGIIRLVNQLDRETTPTYDLMVTVTDRGEPPQSTSVQLAFSIRDVNDEPPVFTQSTYSIAVREESSSIDNLIQIEATDRDTGNGGEVVRYEILEGNNGGRFNLSSSGILSSLVRFDREERAEYVLTVAAYDGGAELLRGTARILVTITDINDNPSFNNGHLSVLIYALDGIVAADEIAPLYFEDPDSDDAFQDCVVLSQDQATTFRLERGDCTIHLNVENPREAVYNFVRVTGNDGVHPTVNATATIRVEHIDSSLLSANNLVTVTINASSEAYINEGLNITLPSRLASALDISEANLQIVSVREGISLPDSTVEVSFIATSNNGDLLSSTTILHRLFLNRESLTINRHTLLNLPLDACASEPCRNQAGCRTVQTVTPTEKTIGTKQFVFFAPRVRFSYECLCLPGTTGDHCEINFDDCYSNPCQQGAKCTDRIDGFSCSCPDGYSGEDCGTPPAECSVNVCQNGATCIVVNEGVSCKCSAGYYGPLCQYHYSVPSSFCNHDNNPCQNGAECSTGRDSFSCVCLPGFSGEFCEMETQLQGGCLGNPCFNGSTCEDIAGPHCTCSIGFTGPVCRWPLNSCELEPCLNGGMCQPGLYDSHICICPSGFTGEDCSLHTSACLLDPCTNGGRCLAGEDGTYTCECLSGYYGRDCEFTADPVDACEMIDCSDSGNCTAGRDTFTCSCDAGFSGGDCSVDDDTEDVFCARNPCLHGGVCVSESPGSFRCDCSPGFTGAGCENNINECADNPCENGGTCVDGINGYTCLCPGSTTGYNCQVHCPDGLAGMFCQISLSPCSESPCQNNSTCSEERGRFSCDCPPTHTGNRCETEISCSPVSCQNGGTCVQSPAGGIECECGPEFTGENCELLTVSFSGSQTVSSYRAFDSLEIRGRGRIEFEFATLNRNGLLLYNTQLQNGRSDDFIAVEVVGGALRVSISRGSGEGSVSIMNSPLGVADGSWHQVVIETVQKDFEVSLDDCLLLPDTLLPFASCVTMETTPGASISLDLGLPFWIGGVPFSIPTNSTRISSQGVTGCIRGVRIDGEILDLEGYAVERNSQRGCSHMEPPECLQEPSVCGGGRCVPVFDGYSCDCPRRVEGDACERAAQTVMFGGSTLAKYSLLSYQSSMTRKRQLPDVPLWSTISNQISLSFRTEMNSGRGLLFYTGDEETGDELYLQLENGTLVLHINLGSREEQLSLTNVLVTDSLWHDLEIERLGLEVTTIFDNVTSEHTLHGTQLSLDATPIFYVGGRPDSGDGDILAPFIGCLQDIRVDNTPLPTVDSNSFARVEFSGDVESLYRCALGECLRQPCGRGNCTEREANNYECVCDVGVRTVSRPCPVEATSSRYTLPILFGAVAGGLLLIVVSILIIMLCYKYTRNRRHKLDLSASRENVNGVDLFGRQCLVISNEAGGGEVDTHIGVDEISSALYANQSAIQKEKEEVEWSSDDEESSEGFSVQPQLKITRASSPTLSSYIQEKIESVTRDYRDMDSLCEFEEEGRGSETGSLSSICSSSAESEYTVERLRRAGPEFTQFIDLLTSLLEEEEGVVDGDSEKAHSGNTQPTQGLTPLSQDIW